MSRKLLLVWTTLLTITVAASGQRPGHPKPDFVNNQWISVCVAGGCSCPDEPQGSSSPPPPPGGGGAPGPSTGNAGLLEMPPGKVGRPGVPGASPGVVGIPGKGFGPGAASIANGCTWVTIAVGRPRPWSILPPGMLRIRAETPSPELATPQALHFSAGWTMYAVSSERTPADVPRYVYMLNPSGLPVEFRFEDGESIGVPTSERVEDLSARLFMVDAEGWSVTNEPAFYDLYPGNGDQYRFGAHPGSSNYLKLVRYRSVSGRIEEGDDLGYEVLYTSNAVLRQIRGAACLADIVPDGDYRYFIRFYRLSDLQSGRDSNGFYVIADGAQPFLQWTIENPDTSNDCNRLLLTEQVGDKTRSFHFEYHPGVEAWDLISGGGLVYDRKETVWDDAHENRLEIETISGPDGKCVLRKASRYHRFPWGENMTAEIRDPDGIGLTNTFLYYEDSTQTGKYKKIAGIRYADGDWVRYDYDIIGRKILEMRPWQDTPYDVSAEEADVTYYDYTPVDTGDVVLVNDQRPRTVTRKVLGKVVRKTYYAYPVTSSGELWTIEEKCSSAQAAYGDPANLRTVWIFYGTNEDPTVVGRLKRVIYPDGRMDSYTYEFGNYVTNEDPSLCYFAPDPTGGAWRVTVVHGTTNSPSGLAYKSTKQTRVFDSAGNEVLRETYVYAGSGTYERIWWRVVTYDVFGNYEEVAYPGGLRASAQWSAPWAKDYEKDFFGVEHQYYYDGLGRLVRDEKLTTGGVPGLTVSYQYDAAGHRVAVTREGGEEAVTISNEYDVAGRLVKTVDPAGLIRRFEYSQGGRVRTEIRPGGGEVVTRRYADGRVESVTGSAAIARFYEYGVDTNGMTWVLKRTGRTNSPMWEKTFTDLLGREARVERAGYRGSVITTRYTYDRGGRVIRVQQTGSADRIMQYDELGHLWRRGLDVDGNGELDPAGNDRIDEISWQYVQLSNEWWRQTTRLTYPDLGSSRAVTVSVERALVSGSGCACQAEQRRVIDIWGTETFYSVSIDRDNKRVTRTTRYSYSTNVEMEVEENGLVVSQSFVEGGSYTYQYDALERRVGVTDGRKGTTTTHYNEKGQVDYVVDAAGNRTSYTYDPSNGLRIAVTDPLSNTVYYAYDAMGRVTNTWGATYPVAYEYDEFGRLVCMKTWREAGGEPDVTRWYFDPASGLLTNKVYADGRGPIYEYDAAGRLTRRVWARGISTEYSYDLLGQLTNIDYSDDTPDIAVSYDRLGRVAAVRDVLGVRTNVYDSNTLVLVEERLPDGTILSRSYDEYGRASGIGLGEAYSVAYGYDTRGRLGSVSSSVAEVSFEAEYSYVPDGRLLSGYSLRPAGSGAGLAVERTYEPHRDLVLAITNRWDGEMISSFSYTNDAAGRRVRRVDSGSVTNTFGYNARSELIEAVMGTNRYSYRYDEIGNRQVVTNNGEVWYYLVNELNQYTNIHDGVTNVPGYDADGNLTNWAGWAFTWNGENRLRQARKGTTVVEFAYDYLGRRVRKVVNGVTNRFVYDGWNLVAEIISTSTNYYVWGLDLSGSLQGAGGIGGLLAAIEDGDAYFPCYDANGNVTDLVDTNGAMVGHYEYDPYGNIIAQTGAKADDFNFLFSTKYPDRETGLYYYGYRLLGSRLGRFISRDPIGGCASENLYGFVRNDAVDLWDFLGLDPCSRFKEEHPEKVRDSMGGVVCYNGKKYACCWHCNDFPSAQRDDFEECIKEHERDHFDDLLPCSTSPWDRGRVYRPPWRPGVDRAYEECKAYGREIDCLKKKRDDKCKDLCGEEKRKCEEPYNGRIKNLEGKRSKACAGMPP